MEIERQGAVLIAAINRPQSRNAVNALVAQAMERALDELERSDSLRVAVITGRGGYFSAGMDLKAFARGERAETERGGFAGIVERTTEKVLIAAIEGFAVAGGLEIALACDLLVAARDAKLGIPEVGVGLIASSGGLLHLPRRIPYHVSMEMAVTGEPIDAERALALGLVNRLAEPGHALDVALELAAKISAQAPLAVAGSKRTIRASRDWPTEQEWVLQRQLSEPIAKSADALEGARAFAERRPPRWRSE